MTAVLSYWEEYFTPGADAPLSGHSTGQIASHLHALLETRMGCRYVPQQPRRGVDAELFVGHFWSFLDYCRLNRFERRIAVYPVASPPWTRELLARRAAELSVPMPSWDLPPAGFDHRATMDAADAVLVVGNRFTLETFAPEDRPKIHLANYAPDRRLDDAPLLVPPPPRTVCYVATHCDLRKGFMDVLEAWRGVADAEPGATLDVMGAIRAPWDGLLASKGTEGIRYRGFVNSKEPAYRDVIRSSRFVYLPTYSEGQVGTLLEAIQLGCVPITTRASGIDDRVLEHCVIVEARDIEGQRNAILDALSWSDEDFLTRRTAVMAAAREAHTWAAFETAVTTMLDQVKWGDRMTHVPGYVVVDDYLDPIEAARVLASINAYVADHDLPIIHREHAKRGLHYGVIDGLRVHRHLPDLERIYREVNAKVNALLPSPVVPLRNEVAALNVNVTPPGGSYRWHYDRNSVTATLYLNGVEGGELELCPNYRLGAGRHLNGLTRQADRLLQTSLLVRLFGRKVAVAPRPGALVIMRGNRCLHSVSPVLGTEPRVNLVMSFDDPRRGDERRDELDRYLYSAESVDSVDPNYRR